MKIKTITKGDIFEKIPSKVMNEMGNAVLTVLREWKMFAMDLICRYSRNSSSEF